MSVEYNAREVFEIGVQIEKNGQAFYNAAAEVADDEDARELLADLAEWEKAHVALFQNLMRTIPEAAANESITDPQNEVALYLKAAAGSHIFRESDDPAVLLRGCDTALDILKRAVTFEKDSVVLYTSMKDLVPERLGKKNIDALISEELKHLALLHGKIEELHP